MIMLQRLQFGARLKLLRTTHNLKSAHLAFLSKTPTPASITQFESGAVMPRIENLASLANLFAVTIDWILGDDDFPYSKTKIEKQENGILMLSSPDIVMTDAIDYYRATWFLRDPLAEEYINPNTRQNYSLPVRANILYCLHVLKALTFNLHPENNNVDAKAPIAFLPEKRIEKKYLPLYNLSINTLDRYLIQKKDITVPIFDILPQATIDWRSNPNAKKYVQF